MRIKKLWLILLVFLLMLVGLPLQTLVNASAHQLQAASTSPMPLLRLPWVSGSNQINVGYTYGCGDHVDNPGTKYRDAFAIDFGLPAGTKVAAVANGIAHTGNDGATTNYGFYIWIAHTNPNGSLNGYISLYAHLSSFAITDGQTVKQGAWIGNSGSTGHSTGPHLHFSFRSGFDGTNLSSAAPFKPEPMSGYTGFGHYGVTQDTGCNINTPIYSPFYYASPWTQFADNASNNAFNPFETTLGRSNVSQLTQEWQSPAQISGGASPAIDNGMVYIPTHWGTLYALNPTTGNVVWQQGLGGLSDDTPTVYNGVVLLSATDGNIYAFNATTGNPLWTKPGYSATKVAEANGIVYAPIFGSNGYQSFAAYKVKNGVQIWKVPFTCSGTVSAPAVANNLVFFVCAGILYALHISNGSTAWTQPNPFSNGSSSLSVANGIVYVSRTPQTSTDYNLVAYNATTGAFIWGQRTDNYAFENLPVVANGVLFVGTENGLNPNYMYALNAKTGAQIWKQPLNGYIFSNTFAGTASAVANGVLYVVIENSSTNTYSLIAFNTSNGKTLTTLSGSPSPYIDSSPVVANGRLYLLYYSSGLVSFHIPGL